MLCVQDSLSEDRCFDLRTHLRVFRTFLAKKHGSDAEMKPVRSTTLLPCLLRYWWLCCVCVSCVLCFLFVFVLVRWSVLCCEFFLWFCFAVCGCVCVLFFVMYRVVLCWISVLLCL